MMVVILAMPVKCDCIFGLRSKQLPVFSGLRDALRRPGATHMSIETNNRIRFSHDDMQVVGDEHDAAIQRVPDFTNQPVHRDLTGEIDTLNRFIQHKQIGFSNNGSRYERTLEFTT